MVVLHFKLFFFLYLNLSCNFLRRILHFEIFKVLITIICHRNKDSCYIFQNLQDCFVLNVFHHSTLFIPWRVSNLWLFIYCLASFHLGTLRHFKRFTFESQLWRLWRKHVSITLIRVTCETILTFTTAKTLQYN